MFAISFVLHSPLTPATWDVQHIILQLCGVFFILFKARYCKSSVRNSQDAIFMQIALCAKLRSLRSTENTGNVGRMHSKCKSFLGVVNSSSRSLLPAPFSSFSLWLLGEKNPQQLQKWKDGEWLVAPRTAPESDKGTLCTSPLCLWKNEATTKPRLFSYFPHPKQKDAQVFHGFSLRFLWHLLGRVLVCALLLQQQL